MDVKMYLRNRKIRPLLQKIGKNSRVLGVESLEAKGYVQICLFLTDEQARLIAETILDNLEETQD